MLFFYIRHGDPTYDPDALTPLGHRQAEAVGRRLAMYGLDRVFASTSNRAIQTATPACEMLKLKPTLVDFANESYAWEQLTYDSVIGKTWLFNSPEMRKLFTTLEIKSLGDEWYNHPQLLDKGYKEGIERIKRGADEFFLSLGYEHVPGTGRYKVVKPNNERVALFAHQGFGLAFLSCLLDIPYPEYATHFDICLTGVTVIDFREEDGIAIPKVLMHSGDGHLLTQGLPTSYGRKF